MTSTSRSDPTPPAATDGADARTRMIQVAEQLFAEYGIEAVSLRTVGAKAGQRNNSAAQYHFGSKEGLIRAVIGFRAPEVDSRRQELVEELRRSRDPLTADALVRLMVAPLAESIGHPEGPTWYLRFLANVMAHPSSVDPDELLRIDQPALRFMRRELRQLFPDLPARTFRRRSRWMALTAFRILADHERDLATAPRQAPATEQVVDELVSMLVALLQAP